MSVEKYKELNGKWALLLDDLSKSEATKYKYAQAYERIVKYNKPKDYKILLGTAHRVFYKDKSIKPLKGKNEMLINEFDDSDFTIGGDLMMDLVLPFVEAISDMIVEECHTKNNTLSHLIRKNNKVILVY
jgi:hypothetical protein